MVWGRKQHRCGGLTPRGRAWIPDVFLDTHAQWLQKPGWEIAGVNTCQEALKAAWGPSGAQHLLGHSISSSRVEKFMLCRKGILPDGRLHFTLVWSRTARSSFREGMIGVKKNKPGTKVPGEEILQYRGGFGFTRMYIPHYQSGAGEGSLTVRSWSIFFFCFWQKKVFAIETPFNK